MKYDKRGLNQCKLDKVWHGKHDCDYFKENLKKENIKFDLTGIRPVSWKQHLNI